MSIRRFFKSVFDASAGRAIKTYTIRIVYPDLSTSESDEFEFTGTREEAEREGKRLYEEHATSNGCYEIFQKIRK